MSEATKDIEKVLNRYDPYLQTCRTNVLASLSKAPLSPVLIEYFERGKMLRPLLVFVAASTVGADPMAVTKAAEAIELLHGASLIHDDIVDESDERRGLPSLHVRLGLGTALVLGDYLLSQAFAVLSEGQAIHAQAKVLEAVNTLSRQAQRCCRGQVQELVQYDRLDPEEAYLSIVRDKTASQFVASTTIGAILGGGTRSQIEALDEYGTNVGLAFQLRDDMLDLIGEAHTLGKPAGKSLAQDRPMLPLIYLDKYGSLEARAEYRRMRQAGFERSKLVDLLERENIFERVEAVHEDYVAASLKALENLPPTDEIEALQTLALYVTVRRS